MRLLPAQANKERARLLGPPGLREACAAQAVRALEARAQPRGFGGVSQGVGVAPGQIVSDRNSPEELRHHRVQRTEPDGVLGVLYGLAVVTRECESVTEVKAADGGIGVEADGLADAAIASSVRLSIKLE